MIKPRRDERQLAVHGWCIAAFGDNHAHSIPQRGIRLAEEAIETAQACGCDKEMVHRLVDHIYSKPAGELFQEIGGVGITLLALAEASGHSAEAAEKAELQRILSKPPSHFTARNDAKNAAGFNVAAAAKATSMETRPVRHSCEIDMLSDCPGCEAEQLKSASTAALQPGAVVAGSPHPFGAHGWNHTRGNLPEPDVWVAAAYEGNPPFGAMLTALGDWIDLGGEDLSQMPDWWIYAPAAQDDPAAIRIVVTAAIGEQG